MQSRRESRANLGGSANHAQIPRTAATAMKQKTFGPSIESVPRCDALKLEAHKEGGCRSQESKPKPFCGGWANVNANNALDLELYLSWVLGRWRQQRKTLRQQERNQQRPCQTLGLRQHTRSLSLSLSRTVRQCAAIKTPSSLAFSTF